MNATTLNAILVDTQHTLLVDGMVWWTGTCPSASVETLAAAGGDAIAAARIRWVLWLALATHSFYIDQFPGSPPDTLARGSWA